MGAQDTTCPLPDTCPSTACAGAFVAYYDDCALELQGHAAELPLPQFAGSVKIRKMSPKMSLLAAPERAGRVWLLPHRLRSRPEGPSEGWDAARAVWGALGYLPLPELAQHAIMRVISEPSLDRHRSRSTFGLSIDISSRVPCPDSAS